MITGGQTLESLRQGVREVCKKFRDEYWRGLDARREYPEEFVKAMTQAGYLGALIPEEYGGMGLSLSEATVILEEINRSGGNAQPAHAQVYTMGTLLRHGSEEQKREYLPKIASGEIRLQAFGVTEPEAGTNSCSRASRCLAFSKVTLGKATRAGPVAWCGQLLRRLLKPPTKSLKSCWKLPSEAPSGRPNDPSSKPRR